MNVKDVFNLRACGVSLISSYRSMIAFRHRQM